MTRRLEPGESLGDYAIDSVAGAGGMGVVYRATQRSLGRVVALKVIRCEIASAPEYRERFLREARLAASVDHPHVVTVYDVGDEEGRLYLAMQWVDGQDLERLLARSGRLAPERAVAIATQVARALDAVHRVSGLVHRDVKPANVLLGKVEDGDHAYLTDFGVARPSRPTEQLTQAGWVVGTTGYLSPEQIEGAEPGPRSDLYALGCVFFEALTGQQPFTGDNDMGVRWAHAHNPRPLASQLLPAIGGRYDRFLATALAVDPEQRFGSGREFAEALAVAHSGAREAAGQASVPVTYTPTSVGPPTPQPPPAPYQYAGSPYATPPPAPAQQPRAGNPLALVLLALVALAGIGVGGLAAAGTFSRETPKGPTTSTTTSSTSHTTSDTTSSTQTRHSTTRSSRTEEREPRRTSAPSAQPQEGPFEAVFPGVAPTERDVRGYNIGPGCSDDPRSSLPGCNDAPTVPFGDSAGSCPNGLTVDRRTTSCGLAENVYEDYTADGPVTAFSPERGRSYTFSCRTAGTGTTGYRFCLGEAGEAILYVRWLP